MIETLELESSNLSPHHLRNASGINPISTAMKSASSNSWLRSRHNIAPALAIKSLSATNVNSRPQTPVLSLILPALVSASLLLTVATACLSLINYSYLTSFTGILGFSYSDFDITPQDQIYAAWDSLVVVFGAALVSGTVVVLSPPLFAILCFAGLKIWQAFERSGSTFKKWSLLKNRQRKTRAANRRPETKLENSLYKIVTTFRTPFIVFVFILFFGALIVKGAQDASLRGEHDALVSVDSGPIVTLKMNDGTAPRYRYIRRIGDKLLVLPMGLASEQHGKSVVVLVRRADVAEIASELDIAARRAEFKQDIEIVRRQSPFH